ncbi:MAG: SDR family NAD(P)-dependent oxidoreductase, partial [Eubacteriales bacterium]|nr:SDR family NAD(P)-dependent oxidoreductase [Eubacteriales bacterium]
MIQEDTCLKTVVVTGATSGIGLAVARVLAARGFYVIGVGSNQESCDREAYPRPHRLNFIAADLLQQSEVKQVAEEIRVRLVNGELYALINNAGCVRSRYMTTEEGYEHQFALNHLAGFMLTHELMPNLIKAGGRIIMTGSGSHTGAKIMWDDVMMTKRYRPLRAYKQSKLCNMLFAKALNDRYAAHGIRAYVVDPGLVRTNIGNKRTGWLVSLIWSLRKRAGVGPDIPAATYEWLCRENEAPKGFYYYMCKERSFSRQVTAENAERLFALSERLCGISYDRTDKRTEN